MKNRELFEYLSVCYNRKISVDREEWEDILESEISVKELFNTLNNVGYNDYAIGIVICTIFRKFKSDREIEKALKIVSDYVKNCVRYIGKANWDNFRINLNHNLYMNKHIETSRDLECCLKIVNFSILITLDNKKYPVIECEDKKCVVIGNNKEKIGAIIFKDGNKEILKIETEEDYNKMVDRVLKLDYDFCLCANRKNIAYLAKNLREKEDYENKGGAGIRQERIEL